MDDLCRPNNVVPLVIRSHCTNQAVLNEYASIMPIHCIAVTQAEDLCATSRLSCGDMDEEQKPLEERVDLGDILLRRRDSS